MRTVVETVQTQVMNRSSIRPSFLVLAIFFALPFGLSCTVNRAQKHFLLAERLWSDAKYTEAVLEYDQVIKFGPTTGLGIKALYRGALTQTTFLGEHTAALQKLRIFSRRTQDRRARWEAEKLIGSILFEKLRRYPAAVTHYQEMIKERPKSEEIPLIRYRIARSQYFMWQFEEALSNYRRLREEYPDSEWGEKAALQIGHTLMTLASHDAASNIPLENSKYQLALEAFESFRASFPNSKALPEAEFGIANCLEGLDRLEEAFKKYEAIVESYPSPNVVRIRLLRIKERISQKNQ